MAEIEQLRELLLKREQQRLDDLERQLRDREQRIAALGEILPDSLRRLRDDKRLERSLNPQLVRSIDTTIRANPKRFAAMLYPVIGPAIRRAVAEALKGLLDNINRTMEHSLSARSWRWRLEAWRSGVPFSQIVVKHTLAYSIDEVFLVQHDSGLLITRAARSDRQVLDRDAVAAMLSAIQSFMQESFATDDDHPVRSIEVGEHTLWIVPGVQAVLVAVIQGTISREARGQLQQQLEALHDQYLALLQGFHEQTDIPDELIDALTVDLSACLLSKELDQPPGASVRKKSYAGALVLLLLVSVVAGWFGWRWWQLDDDRDQLVTAIQTTPGWVLMDDALNDGQVRIRALRDPLAADAGELTQALGLDPARVSFQLQNYQSANPVLAVRRLALAVGVEPQRLTWSGNSDAAGLEAVQVSGALPRSTWQALSGTTAAFGLRLANPPALDIASLRQRLAAPDEAQLEWRGDVLELSGEVPQAWREALPDRLAELGLSTTVDDLSVSPLERRTSLLRQRWDEHLLRFSDELEITDESREGLRLFIQETQALQALTDDGVLPFNIVLTGLTDGPFNASVNVRLRAERADWLRLQLLNAGLPERSLNIVPVQADTAVNNMRAVRIRLPINGDG